MRSVQSTLFTLLVASGAAYADTTINLTRGVSPISRDVYELHMIVFWLCVAIGILVFGVMAYAMIYHRKSRGAKAAEFHTHPILEIAWTIIPALILIVLAIPATKVLLNMNNYDKEELTIKITGYQWKWHYEYLEDGVSFFSNLSTPYAQLHNQAAKTENYLREVDHPLVIPIHKKVRFLITSNDVNHAWWVPDFGVKRDAVSGFINEAWTVVDKPGTYRGQCAELCGINHAFMPIVVIALSETDYKNWVAKQKGELTAGDAEAMKPWTLKELSDRGQEVYNRICAACHQPNGQGLPPTFPALKGDGVVTGPIAHHIEVVFNGRSGTAMQAFKGQLSDVELAAVVTYERNAFGNNTGTSVQPIQIKAFRDGKAIDEALKVMPGAKAKAPEAATQMQDVNSPAPTATVPSAPTATAPTASAAESQAKPASSPPASNPQDALKEVMARGEKIYLSACAACHQPTGLGMPPTFPALKGDPITTGPVVNHINRVMNGKQGTAMVPFKDQFNDQEIADVITYERNAWGNNTGSLVTAGQITSARQQDQNKS